MENWKSFRFPIFYFSEWVWEEREFSPQYLQLKPATDWHFSWLLLQLQTFRFVNRFNGQVHPTRCYLARRWTGLLVGKVDRVAPTAIAWTNTFCTTLTIFYLSIECSLYFIFCQISLPSLSLVIFWGVDRYYVLGTSNSAGVVCTCLHRPSRTLIRGASSERGWVVLQCGRCNKFPMPMTLFIHPIKQYDA